MTDAAILAELRRLNSAVNALTNIILTERDIANAMDVETTHGRVRRIQMFVADAYGLNLGTLCARNRRRHIVWPRQVAIYLCRALTDASAEFIGRQFGGLDHGTIFHSVDAVKDAIQDDSTNREVLNLRAKLEADLRHIAPATGRTLHQEAA